MDPIEGLAFLLFFFGRKKTQILGFLAGPACNEERRKHKFSSLQNYSE